MGTLHAVYQLKPRVMYCGTILRVRKDKETVFLEKYTDNQIDYTTEQSIFQNILVTNTRDGKVRRAALYATERIIDCKEPGSYVLILDSSKHGFDNDFNAFLNDIAPYLEDNLFYVTWDNRINRYEITAGTLSFKRTTDFDRWKYDFGEYLIQNYTTSKQIIANFYADQTYEMILRHKEMIDEGENPKELYDMEDYEELLHKISNYKNDMVASEFKALEDWLTAQIDTYEL